MKWFAIFRTTPEQLPPELTRKLANYIAGSSTDRDPESAYFPPPNLDRGFTLGLAQRVHPPGTELEMWVIPGRRYLLIFPGQDYRALRAEPTQRVIQRGLLGRISRSENDIRSYGLVPNGVTQVRLSDSLVAPVADNVYWVRTANQAFLPVPELIRSS